MCLKKLVYPKHFLKNKVMKPKNAQIKIRATYFCDTALLLQTMHL